jgi:hypothetical protein
VRFGELHAKENIIYSSNFHSNRVMARRHHDELERFIPNPNVIDPEPYHGILSPTFSP